MKKIIFIFSIVNLLLIVGCGGQNNNSPVDSIQQTQAFLNAVETGIVKTIAAGVEMTATMKSKNNLPAEKSEIVPSSTMTAQAQPSIAPTQPSSSFTATPTQLSTPCYRAELVEETIPDGTVIKIGQGFTKTWIVKNTGVCAWSENFRWILVEGEDFRAPTNLEISTEEILPGETIQISLEMGPPFIPGHYRSVYKIFTDEGAEVTPNGFWIDVEVVEK